MDMAGWHPEFVRLCFSALQPVENARFNIGGNHGKLSRSVQVNEKMEIILYDNLNVRLRRMIAFLGERASVAFSVTVLVQRKVSPSQWYDFLLQKVPLTGTPDAPSEKEWMDHEPTLASRTKRYRPRRHRDILENPRPWEVDFPACYGIARYRTRRSNDERGRMREQRMER